MTDAPDPQLGAELAVEGATRALQRALLLDPEWVARARMALRVYTYYRGPFTSESIWEVAGKPKKGVDPRALGGMLSGYSRAGYIEKTEDAVKKAELPSRHRGWTTIWVGTALGAAAFRNYVEGEES